jgi:hypothetical protein
MQPMHNIVHVETGTTSSIQAKPNFSLTTQIPAQKNQNVSNIPTKQPR